MAKKDKKAKRDKQVAVTPSYPTYATKPSKTHAPEGSTRPAHGRGSGSVAAATASPVATAPAPVAASGRTPVAVLDLEPTPLPLQVELSTTPATLPLAVEASVSAASLPLVVEVQPAPGAPGGGGGTPERPHVSVTGTGRTERAADIARATFVVEATRHTAAEARAVAAGTASEVLDALAGAGVDRPDVNTAGLDVSPNWEHEGNRPVRKGFTVTNRIAVVVRDLDAVGRVLDAALESGASGLDGVSFQLADPSGDTAEARRRAVADARERAETIASAAGLSLGRLVGIAEGGAPVPMPRGPMRMAAMAMDAAPPTPVVPGSVEVTVSVSAEWELVEG